MIGPRVAERRRAAGLTQTELAYKAGLHPQTVSDIERDVTAPALATVSALAMALGCLIDDLVDKPAGKAVAG